MRHHSSQITLPMLPDNLPYINYYAFYPYSKKRTSTYVKARFLNIYPIISYITHLTFNFHSSSPSTPCQTIDFLTIFVQNICYINIKTLLSPTLSCNIKKPITSSSLVDNMTALLIPSDL